MTHGRARSNRSGRDQARGRRHRQRGQHPAPARRRRCGGHQQGGRARRAARVRREGAHRAGRGGGDDRGRDAFEVRDPRRHDGARRADLSGDHRAGHPLHPGQGRGARLPLARPGGLRHRRGRLPARGGGPDHGGSRARPRGLSGANRLRGARRRRRARVSSGALSLPVLVAPDSFKGSFSAADVAAAIAAGLRDAGREAVELPVADGGEGTMDVLGGELRTARVSDPLGRPVEASFALLDDGRTAVVETAQASGFRLVAEEERDAYAASTRGTGELIAAAVEAGADKVIVTVGGSATMDGGAGALEALEGIEVELDVLCDVRTPWEKAPAVFGPQKGADPATVERLEKRLDELARPGPRDPRGEPLTGAAGALSGGLWAFRGAKLFAGAPYVLDAVGFDERMRESAFVVTGEGRLDDQTLEGKVVGEVATRCRQGGVPCHAVVGKNALEPFKARILDLASVREAGTRAALRAAGQALVGG